MASVRRLRQRLTINGQRRECRHEGHVGKHANSVANPGHHIKTKLPPRGVQKAWAEPFEPRREAERVRRRPDLAMPSGRALQQSGLQEMLADAVAAKDSWGSCRTIWPRPSIAGFLQSARDKSIDPSGGGGTAPPISRCPPLSMSMKDLRSRVSAIPWAQIGIVERGCVSIDHQCAADTARPQLAKSPI